MSDMFTQQRASFAERCARLAGTTTYREPIGGNGSRRADYLPDEHALAAAMACARRGSNDIGPDIAVALATGSSAHRTKIVTELAAALLATTSRLGERCRDHLPQVAADCYLGVMGESPRGVSAVSPRDYLLLQTLGCAVLWEAAERSFQRAAHAYYAQGAQKPPAEACQVG